MHSEPELIFELIHRTQVKIFKDIPSIFSQIIQNPPPLDPSTFPLAHQQTLIFPRYYLSNVMAFLQVITLLLLTKNSAISKAVG